jgi:hypothetical protein
VDEIERAIQAAEFFVVLVSEQSIHSDMLRQEVALAHQLCVEKKLRILPVRVAYSATLPYDLAAYLNPFQYTSWKAGEPFQRICSEIEAAISHLAGSPPLSKAQAASVSSTSFPPNSACFDAASLDRLASELAAFVGPVARLLVNRAAKQAHSWKQLYDTLAAEIPAGEERKTFLAKRPSN